MGYTPLRSKTVVWLLLISLVVLAPCRFAGRRLVLTGNKVTEASLLRQASDLNLAYQQRPRLLFENSGRPRSGGAGIDGADP